MGFVIVVLAILVVLVIIHHDLGEIKVIEFDSDRVVVLVVVLCCGGGH